MNELDSVEGNSILGNNALILQWFILRFSLVVLISPQDPDRNDVIRHAGLKSVLWSTSASVTSDPSSRGHILTFCVPVRPDLFRVLLFATTPHDTGPSIRGLKGGEYPQDRVLECSRGFDQDGISIVRRRGIDRLPAARGGGILYCTVQYARTTIPDRRCEGRDREKRSHESTRSNLHRIPSLGQVHITEVLRVPQALVSSRLPRLTYSSPSPG